MALPLLALAGGALNAGSSLLGDLFGGEEPQVPRQSDLTGRSSVLQWGGLNPGQQDWLDRLSGISNRNARQQRAFDRLTNAQGRSGLMDKQLGALNKFVPQYNDAMLKWFDQYAPQEIAQQLKYGGQLAQGTQDIQKQLNPEYFDLRTQLGQQLMGSLGQGLNQDQLGFYSSQLGAQQAGRGMFDSPLSAANSARALTDLNMRQQQQNLGNAQNYLNTYQMPGVPRVQQVGAMPGASLMGNSFTGPSYNDTLGLQSSLSGLQFAQDTNNYNRGVSNISGLFSGAGNTMNSIGMNNQSQANFQAMLQALQGQNQGY